MSSNLYEQIIGQRKNIRENYATEELNFFFIHYCYGNEKPQVKESLYDHELSGVLGSIGLG